MPWAPYSPTSRAVPATGALHCGCDLWRHWRHSATSSARAQDSRSVAQPGSHPSARYEARGRVAVAAAPARPTLPEGLPPGPPGSACQARPGVHTQPRSRLRRRLLLARLPCSRSPAHAQRVVLDPQVAAERRARPARRRSTVCCGLAGGASLGARPSPRGCCPRGGDPGQVIEHVFEYFRVCPPFARCRLTRSQMAPCRSRPGPRGTRAPRIRALRS